MMDSNISDSMAKSIFNNEIIQNMTDETFDKILEMCIRDSSDTESSGSGT